MLTELHPYLGVALAGMASFLSPCVLPLVPAYFAYLAGAGARSAIHDLGARSLDVWGAATLAVLGFAAVFVALGDRASAVGQFLARQKDTLAAGSGLVLIALGLELIAGGSSGTQHGAGLNRSRGLILGLALAFGWTPCIGPVLSAILALAQQPATEREGLALLAAFATGLGAAFIAAAWVPILIVRTLPRTPVALTRCVQAAGALTAITGVLFVTGTINDLGGWLLTAFPGLGDLEEWAAGPDLRAAISKRAGH